jgi:hypothetical protein
MIDIPLSVIGKSAKTQRDVQHDQMNDLVINNIDVMKQQACYNFVLTKF